MTKNKSTKVVLASGVFDVIHPGHLYYLTEAKKHGNRLVVVVTSDEQAEREKRKPQNQAADRAALIASLPPVDEVFVGPEPYDPAATLQKAGADIVALGYDQRFDEATLKELGVTVVRCPELPGHATSDLL